MKHDQPSSSYISCQNMRLKEKNPKFDNETAIWHKVSVLKQQLKPNPFKSYKILFYTVYSYSEKVLTFSDLIHIRNSNKNEFDVVRNEECFEMENLFIFP